MKLKIEIELNNAAFEDNKTAEVLSILDYLRERMEDSATDWQHSVVYLYDTNGNLVGTAETTGK